MTTGITSVDNSNSDIEQDDIASLCLKLLKQKSPSTYIHCIRASIIAKQFGRVMNLDDQHLTQLIQGCQLHDIGKLLVPNSVLHCNCKLTERDWVILKLHPVCGGHLLDYNGCRLDEAVWNIVMHHHERWDGYGYPDGLSGSQIPYLARICSVIDAFDSMTSDRGYRKGLSYITAIHELQRNSGSQFDPEIVEAFFHFTRDPGFLPFIHNLPAAI